MNNPVIIVCLMAAFIIDVYILIFAITRKDSSRSAYLVLVTFSVFLYTAADLLYAMSASREGAMTALCVLNLGVPIFAPSLLLMTMRLYQPSWLKPWMLYAASAYGAIIFFVVLFNGHHLLYYTKVEYSAADNYITLGRGVLYWVNQAVALLCVIPAYVILIGNFAKGGKKIRRQMNYIIIGATIIVAVNVLNFTNALPKNIDIMPFVITAALILFNINMTKSRIWDIVSAATNTSFETMEEAMIVLNDQWGFLYCNNSAKNLFPSLNSFPVTEMITETAGWIPELKPRERSGEIIFEREKSGVKRTYRANMNKIIDGLGSQTGWYIIIHDITDMTFLISQLENLATTDPLTGVSNRRHFLDRVSRELDRSSRLNLKNALIMYDIDDFKKVNDTYGHAAGDYILCSVVETVNHQLRSYDMIARYGGEEFVIFTPSPDEYSLHKFAYRLCKAIESAEYVYEGTHIPVTASFGAVQINTGGNFNEAMLAVDEAMYKAKHNGKNQVVIGEINKTGNIQAALEE